MPTEIRITDLQSLLWAVRQPGAKVYVSAGALGYFGVPRTTVARSIANRIRDRLVVDRIYPEGVAYLRGTSVFLLSDW